MRQVRVTRHRWTNEEVEGEGDGEVLRVWGLRRRRGHEAGEDQSQAGDARS